ncbi:hypothetical protein ACET3Z_025245 [Daucus carota]
MLNYREMTEVDEACDFVKVGVLVWSLLQTLLILQANCWKISEAVKRRASISSVASLDMLGAASLIVHHVNDKLTDQQKCPRNTIWQVYSKNMG